jgi:PTS system mannose-specific IIC component
VIDPVGYVDFSAYGYLIALSAVLSLDRTAFFQTMLSRPLPVSLIAGWLMGDMHTGVACGVLLELIWLARLPVGGSVPPDDTTAAIVAVASALLAPSGWSLAASASLGVVVSMPFAYLGRRMDMLARRRNAALVVMAKRALQEGSTKELGLAARLGTFNFFVAAAASAALSLVVARWIVLAGLDYHPEALRKGMEIMSVVLPAIGAGSFLVALPGWRSRLAFGAGAAASVAGLTCVKDAAPLLGGKFKGVAK